MPDTSGKSKSVFPNLWQSLEGQQVLLKWLEHLSIEKKYHQNICVCSCAHNWGLEKWEEIERNNKRASYFYLVVIESFFNNITEEGSWPWTMHSLKGIQRVRVKKPHQNHKTKYKTKGEKQKKKKNPNPQD